MLCWLTAGESHGKTLVAIIDGCPANLPLSSLDLNRDLERRQQGLGRGPRMKEIESDHAEILSGVRQGKTIGSPIALLIPNKSTELFDKAVVEPRPGHADLVGALKYNQKDIRNVIERASARETAAKVAAGAVAKKMLKEFKITLASRVLEIGGALTPNGWEKVIAQAKKDGETVGGIIEISALGLPVGLGSYAQAERRLDGLLAQAVMAIPAVKGVSFGLGFEVAKRMGSKAHDAIFYSSAKGYHRLTNHAGGIEGGVTNGQPIVLRAAVKPIATLLNPLNTINMQTKKTAKALVERSDICAVEPAAVVGEAVVALVLANAFLEKFGGDCVEDILAAFKAYKKRLVK